ncbi:MAG: hypothetical protein E6J90_48060 [Deltaproteobacteria bacterium]|nr:MAG: hypothetical protein E6J90_48060 [Deltaproteobacteria bacterium]
MSSSEREVVHPPGTSCTAARRCSPETRVTVVWSRGDALVPGARQVALPGAETLMYPDLGHVALLASLRVADALIERLSAPVRADAAGAARACSTDPSLS